MGMLAIFVGKVLQLLRESDAAERKSVTFHSERQTDPNAHRHKGFH